MVCFLVVAALVGWLHTRAMAADGNIFSLWASERMPVFLGLRVLWKNWGFTLCSMGGVFLFTTLFMVCSLNVKSVLERSYLVPHLPA